MPGKQRRGIDQPEQLSTFAIATTRCRDARNRERALPNTRGETMRAISLRHILLALVALVSWTQPVDAQAPNLLKNGGFEGAAPTAPDLPESWRPDRAEAGYALTTAPVHGGAHAVAITFDKQTSSAGYAGIIQGIAAEGLEGRPIILSAWLHRGNPKSKAGLWLAFVDAAGKRLGYLNDYDAPWRDAGWNERRLRAVVPAGTKRIAIGISVFEESGTLVIDDVSLKQARE